MTREDAIDKLQDLWNEVYNEDSDGYDYAVAIDMAIEALHADSNKAVPPSLADVYKWERDIALSQLEEYGIGFGEKKRDDLVDVVRCKDCKHWASAEDYDCEIHSGAFGADDFCSYGERREEGEVEE